MKSESLRLEAARNAKEKAKEIFSRFGFINGVGLTRQGEGYAVKVNFASEPRDRSDMPNAIEGIPVIIDVVGPLHKQTVPH